MAQSTILAAGITAASSTDIVITDGSVVNVGIFGAADTHPPRDVNFAVVMVTPDAPIPIAQLNIFSPDTGISGPGTFRVVRPAYVGSPFGVFVNVND